MTVAFFPGKARRAGVALGAVSAGLLVLSACDKPTPLATVTVGTGSVSSEAACYERDGKQIAASALPGCVKKAPTKTVSTSLENTIRVGVDPELADHGWVIFVDGQPIDPELTKTTYRTVPGSQFFAPDPQTNQPAPAKRQLSILQIDNGKPVGVWNFAVKKSSS
jgi:hypothetical protein